MAVKKTAAKSREYAESIIDTVREPLIILDQDLRVVSASRSFYDFFKVKPEETVGQIIYDLGNKQWEIPKLRELLETILPPKAAFDNYEVEHEFTSIGRRTMLLNARQIQRVSGKEKTILLAIEDITEHKRESQRDASLESLRESDERYKAFFDSPLDLVYIFDFEGRFIDANTTTLNRLGYTKEEFSSLNFASLLSEDQLPLAFKTLQEIRETGSQKDLAEFRLWHKNGSDIYVETIGSTIMSNGKPVAILGIARDITDRKLAEKNLRESDERYRALFDRSLDFIYLYDFEGRFIDANDAALNRLGYTRKDIPSLNFASFLSKDQLPLAFNVLQEIQETGIQKKLVEFRLRHKNGSKVHVETTGSTIISNGKPVAILSIARDITVRKVMEEMLALKNVLLSTQQEASIDGILVVDENGCILSYNHRFVELWRLPAKLVEGGVDEPVLQFVTSQVADPQSFLQRVQYLYEHRQETSQDELILADGRFFDRYSAPMIGSDKRYFGRVWYFHDITERKRAEYQREAALEALHESEERIRAITDYAHDAILMMNTDGNLSYWNPAAERILGYTSAEAIGRNLHELVAPERFLPAHLAAFPEFQKTGRGNAIGKTLELAARRKDGQEITVELSLSAVKIKGMWHAVGILQDITERKKNEELIKILNEQQQIILDASPAMIFYKDKENRFIRVNEALARATGMSKEEIEGKTLWEIYSKEEADKYWQDDKEVMIDGKPSLNIIEEMTTPQGTMWVQTDKIPYRNSKGEIIGIIGFTLDITERKQAEKNMVYLSQQNELILTSVAEGILGLDLEGNHTFVNPAAERMLGYKVEELIGSPSHSAWHHTKPDGSPYLREECEILAIYPEGTVHRVSTDVFWRKDGTSFPVEYTSTPVYEDGRAVGVVVTFEDITERKLAEQALFQSEEKYRTILKNIEEGYYEVDLAGNFTFFNDSMCRLYGYSKEELMGMNYRQYADKETSKEVLKVFNKVYSTGETTREFNWQAIRKDGTKIYVELSASLQKDSSGKPIGFSGIIRDITERKRAEEEIQYLATHDALTGLLNRSMFSRQLNYAIQAAQRYNRQFAVLFIDLDRFKIINDTLGHEAGDQLLQEIATRLKQQLRTVDIVGRLGGDEFVILIAEVSDSNHVAIIAHKILAGIIKPMTLMEQKCRITASIGICLYPKDAADEQSLMKNADIAMYLAKEEGKNNYQFYSKDIQSKSLEYLSIETNLRFAIERNELFLHYQAKVDFKTNAITGVEALLRWQNPYLGSVTPTQFIPVAEETGLIIPIGRWVLKTVCAQNVAWQKQGLPAVCTAVNLSLRQLTDDNLIDDIRAALDDSGMAPNLLELEITEGMVMHNPELIISILAKIKSLGVRLAIDDFGTGYSSLAQIQHFPIDTLKVDRSFIRNIPRDAEDMAITEAIIAMGKTLSLTVVAEGVGTEEQMKFLKEHSCDEMQGYYFSKPIVPEQFADLLREHVPSPSGEKQDSPKVMDSANRPLH